MNRKMNLDVFMTTTHDLVRDSVSQCDKLSVKTIQQIHNMFYHNKI